MTDQVTPVRWAWNSDERRCLDCGAEVWAFKDGLICSGCERSEDLESDK